MSGFRGKRAFLATSLLALVVLGGSAVAFRGRLLEAWHLHRLGSPDLEVRRSAVVRLGERGSARAVPALAALLRGDKDLFVEVAVALVSIGDPAVEPFLEAFRTRDLSIRMKVLHGLERAPAGRTLAEVLARVAIEDRWEEVSTAAMGRLPRVGRMAVPFLVPSLEDGRVVLLERRFLAEPISEPIAKRAAEALGSIGPEAEEAVPALLRMAAMPEAKQAAVRIRRPPSIPGDPLVDLRDPDVATRIGAVRRLQERGGAAIPALPALLAALRDPAFLAEGPQSTWSGELAPEDEEGDALPWALLKIAPGSPEVVAALVEALRDPRRGVRAGAAFALGEAKLQGGGAAKALAALVERECGTPPPENAGSWCGTCALEMPRAEPDPPRAALNALVEIGDKEEAAKAIEIAARRGDPGRFTQVVDAGEVLRMDLAPIVPILAGRIAEGVKEAGYSPAGSALRAIGEPALPALLGVLRTGSDRGRLAALWALADSATIEVASGIAGALRDPSPAVRRVAARVIQEGWLGTERAQVEQVSSLIEALEDPEAEVRAAAAKALGLAPPSRKAVRALMEHLPSEPDGAARAAAVNALGMLSMAVLGAERQATPTLVSLFAGLLRSDTDPRVRAAAAESLGRLGAAAESAIPDLVAELGDPAWAGQGKAWSRAYETLEKLGALAVPALIEGLERGPWRTREHAAIALRSLGPAAEAAIPALERRLQDRSRMVRSEAGKTLKAIHAAPAAATPASPGGIPPGTPAPPPATAGEIDAALEWLGSLALPGPEAFPFVRVRWRQYDRTPRTSLGILVRDGATGFTVLGHGLDFRTYRKPGPDVPALQEGRFEPADPIEEACHLLASCEFPGVTGRWIVPPWDWDCAFGWKYPGDRDLELGVLGWACLARGHRELARDLLRYADAVQKMPRVNQPATPATVREVLERGLPGVIFSAALGRLETEECPRAEAIAWLRKVAAAFPKSEEASKAVRIADLLERDQRPAERSESSPAGDRLNVCVRGLRDLALPREEWLDPREPNPTGELIRVGPAAVPRLLGAMEETSFTRMVHGDSPLTVGICAFEVIEEIARIDFDERAGLGGQKEYRSPLDEWADGDWLEELPARRRAIEAWLAEVMEKGEEAVLSEVVEREGEENLRAAERLAERFPATAWEAIALGERASSWKDRKRLVQLAAGLLGDGPVPFLLDEVEKGPSRSGRLAAAEALRHRGNRRGVAAMLEEWIAGRRDKDEAREGIRGEDGPEQVLRFIVRWAEPEELRRALSAGWEKRPIVHRVEVMEVIRELVLRKTGGGTPEEATAGGAEPAAEGRASSLPALERFLISRLDDETRCRGPAKELRISLPGRITRICDLAGSILAAGWPGKHPYPIDGTLGERDRARAAIRAASR